MRISDWSSDVCSSDLDNAVVLQTADGFEGLRCSGLPETLAYDSIPAGLSAKPTLSVTTRSPEATTADVTLTYRSEEHTPELQSLMRTSYAVFCLKKNTTSNRETQY